MIPWFTDEGTEAQAEARREEIEDNASDDLAAQDYWECYSCREEVPPGEPIYDHPEDSELKICEDCYSMFNSDEPCSTR